MVPIGKLWADAYFSTLSAHSKLLYIYLATQPQISTLGVLVLRDESLNTDLNIGITGKVEIEESIEELKESGYLVHFKDGLFNVFIIKEHFLSLSKSKLNIRKAIEEGKASRYRDELLEIYTEDDFKPPLAFTPPTPEEATQHALEKGYIVNGKTFVDYYASNDWYNKNNKKIRSWKLTLEKVWCREENKLEAVDGAPKGYEYFFITTDDGTRVSPKGWRDGIPTHSNYIMAELLRREFEKSKK